MNQIYNNKMEELGYNQLVCDIFLNWEDVKDEILLPERKQGSGNGTIHVFLGAGDAALRNEFPSYYAAVENGEDTSIGAIEVKHYFMPSNLTSMLGYVCKYLHEKGQNVESIMSEILDYMPTATAEKGLFYTNSLLKLSVGTNKLRPYFKQFESNGVFSKLVRQILLPNSSYKISLYKNDKGEYGAFWLIGFNWMDDFEADTNAEYINEPKAKDEGHEIQQIFYGAPGTGKSNKVKIITGEDKESNKPNVFRTTFHPDTDYASFVGCYKPVMKEVKKSVVKPHEDGQLVVTLPSEEIAYEFVPQAFTDAYIYAYDHPDETTYLVIEEINRGNCAQIFGDLFQLLDRNENGISDYSIKADKDLAKHLNDNLQNKDGIKDGKLCLPSNLHILATMNTSDQSLFPIDSAFKRRWDWEYVAIDYSNKVRSSNFKINIEKHSFSWVDFIKEVNARIYKVTQSEDKQMGNFFIKDSVDNKQFCSKVMFYLWNEVLKDEVESSNYFFYQKKDGNDVKFTFTDIYGNNNVDTLVNFMKYLGVKDESQTSTNATQTEGDAQ